ncbi:UNVERIFIED_CONTAM: nAChRalpha1 [Trichonephila clavipes]
MQRPSACGSRVCVWQPLTWVLNFESSHQSKPRIMKLSHNKRNARKVNKNEKRSMYIVGDYENLAFWKNVFSELLIIWSTNIESDWQYVAMVLDRLFLWIFTIACVVGTGWIILCAPSLYDDKQPIDIVFSKVAPRIRRLLRN